MLKALTENPENHNGIYRGKDLTNVYTWDEIYERVHDGSFEDLYLGDYFTVHLTTDLMTRFTGSAFVAGTTYYEMDSGTDVTQRTWTVTQDNEPQEGKVYATKQVVEEDVDYMIAGFDVYMHRGQYIEDYIKEHHIVLISKKCYKTKAQYHHDATAMQGYALSDIFNVTLPCYAKSTKTALNGHMLKRRSRRGTTVDPNAPSSVGGGFNGTTAGLAWVTSELDLPSIEQLTGNSIMSSCWRDTAAEPYKLPIFNFVTLHELLGSTDYAVVCCNVFGVLSGKVYVAAINANGHFNPGSTDNTPFIHSYFVFG
jgi:hypothetical protein